MRIAVIGFGARMSGFYRDHVRRLCPEARIVGVLDPDRAGAEARLPADERGQPIHAETLGTLIAQSAPDAVMVGTRCDLHARIAVGLAPYRLPMFLEKPVATTIDDALALERAYGDDDRRVVVSFPLRATPLADQAARWLAEPGNGRISHVMAVNYVPYGEVYFASWYRDHAVTGGLFLQKATHDFDYLTHLVGSPIVSVAAMALHGRVHQDRGNRSVDGQIPGESDVHYFPGIGTPESGMNEDCSSALIRFANGIHGVYTQNFFARHGAAARGATISGQRSTISFDWCTDRIRRVWHHEAREEMLTVKGTDSEGSGHGGGDGALARNFLAVVRAGAPSIAPLRCGLASAYACLAARESAATGRFIAVHQWGSAETSPEISAEKPQASAHVGAAS